MGCSGNFTSEATLRAAGFGGEIHSNDVSLYSCMLGRLLTGQRVEYQVIDPAFDWILPWMGSDLYRVSVLLVLQDMLSFEKAEYRGNVRLHRVRMWQAYKDNFGALVEKTASGLSDLVLSKAIAPTSFFAGDVFDHFRRFETDRSAVFLCWLPTYVGGYERMYKRFSQIFRWDDPIYTVIDDAARARLLEWVKRRDFVWYDDRAVDGVEPIFEQRARRKRTVWLYSNLGMPRAYMNDRKVMPLPSVFPLADEGLEITRKSRVRVQEVPVKTVEPFKDAYLAKNVDWGRDDFAYAVWVDDRVIGFFGVKRGLRERDAVVLNSEVALPGTRYKRLSKLIAMLAWTRETQKLIERSNELIVRKMMTSMYTDKNGSMLMRGVAPKLIEKKDKLGKRAVTYGGPFNHKTWKQVLHEWLDKQAKLETA